MTQKLYFDDPDVGPARETSHPRFIAFAPDEFYYDCTDEFSPFGNDDGADTLAGLEEWYQEGGEGSVANFLSDFLEGWSLPVPREELKHDTAFREVWLSRDHMNERYWAGECRAALAAAFGQLKIAGEIEPAVRAEGLAALANLLWLNARASELQGNDEALAHEKARFETMQVALQRS